MTRYFFIARMGEPGRGWIDAEWVQAERGYPVSLDPESKYKNRVMAIDVSVILPVMNEGENLRVLLPRMRALLERERLAYEIIVVDGGSTDGTPAIAEAHGARAVTERRRGYAGALETGFAEARGDYHLMSTRTCRMSRPSSPKCGGRGSRGHRDSFALHARWCRIYGSGSKLAEPFVESGDARRAILAGATCRAAFGFIGTRRSLTLSSPAATSRCWKRFVKAYAAGFSVHEVPFTYFPRDAGRSHARLIRFVINLTQQRLPCGLWRLFATADYDERAFYSLIPLQRYWQRRPSSNNHVLGRGASRILVLGCGSSMIIQSLNNAIGMELSMAKARFLNRRGVPIVRGSAFALPFRDASCDCVISSQVIEHIVQDDVLFTEMWRVLEPGGTLLIGTPDYATRAWRTIEPIYGLLKPGGYRDDHISHYTRAGLSEILMRQGFVHEETAYVLGAELIMRWRKPATDTPNRFASAATINLSAAPE